MLVGLEGNISHNSLTTGNFSGNSKIDSANQALLLKLHSYGMAYVRIQTFVKRVFHKPCLGIFYQVYQLLFL